MPHSSTPSHPHPYAYVDTSCRQIIYILDLLAPPKGISTRTDIQMNIQMHTGYPLFSCTAMMIMYFVQSPPNHTLHIHFSPPPSFSILSSLLHPIFCIPTSFVSSFSSWESQPPFFLVFSLLLTMSKPSFHLGLHFTFVFVPMHHCTSSWRSYHNLLPHDSQVVDLDSLINVCILLEIYTYIIQFDYIVTFVVCFVCYVKISHGSSSSKRWVGEKKKGSFETGKGKEKQNGKMVVSLKINQESGVWGERIWGETENVEREKRGWGKKEK